MTSGARPFWIEQLLIKVAIKHPQFHFFLTVEQAKRKGRAVLQTQHLSTELRKAMDWKIFRSFCQNSPGPRLFWSLGCFGAYILLEPHAVNPARPVHVLSSVQCWESAHICSSEPEASRGPLAAGMASMAHHYYVHAHLCSSISFSLCYIPALEGKLLLYNLYGRRKKLCASDFCQGAGDI